MASSWRWLLVAVVLLVGALAFACGGGDDNGDENGDQPTEEATIENGDEATPEATVQDGDGDGATAFEDVPIPEGAEETDSGSWSGSIPFALGADFDAEAYTSLQFKTYELDDSPSDIIDFYRSELGDWDEITAFSGGLAGEEGGYGLWTKDDQRTAAVIGATEADGVTELTVIVGSSD